MSTTTTDHRELARRGEEYYERVLRSKLEPKHVGEYLVLEVESGDYELDASQIAALDRAEAKHPESVFYIMRVGYTAAGGIGASPRRRSKGSRLTVVVRRDGPVQVEPASRTRPKPGPGGPGR